MADSNFLVDEKDGARVPRLFREVDHTVGREIASERIETLYPSQEREFQLPRPKSKQGAHESLPLFRIQEQIFPRPNSESSGVHSEWKRDSVTKLDCSFMRMTNGGDVSWFLVFWLAYKAEREASRRGSESRDRSRNNKKVALAKCKKRWTASHDLIHANAPSSRQFQCSGDPCLI